MQYWVVLALAVTLLLAWDPTTTAFESPVKEEIHAA